MDEVFVVQKTDYDCSTLIGVYKSLPGAMSAPDGEVHWTHYPGHPSEDYDTWMGVSPERKNWLLQFEITKMKVEE